MFRKLFALLKKDFLVESSYRLAFVPNIFAVLISLLTYFFIGKLFGNSIAPALQAFGVEYFSYVLVSMAFFGYVGAGLGSFSERIRAEQVAGTLEAVLSTPTRTSTILLSLIAWNLLLATLDLVVYVCLGIWAFGIDFSSANIASVAIIFLLTIISFSSLGIFSACFMLVLKRDNPFAWVINTLEGVLCGVYFPVSVLPVWLQQVSLCFPITYAIRAIQLAVFKGYAPAMLAKEILLLLGFSVILAPLSLAAFNYSLKKARKDGSLGHY